MSDKLAPSQRHKFLHQGQTIYEWDQTLSEVNLYIELPPGVGAKLLFVDIDATHLRVGINNNPPYLDVRVELLVVSHFEPPAYRFRTLCPCLLPWSEYASISQKPRQSLSWVCQQPLVESSLPPEPLLH